MNIGRVIAPKCTKLPSAKVREAQEAANAAAAPQSGVRKSSGKRQASPAVRARKKASVASVTKQISKLTILSRKRFVAKC